MIKANAKEKAMGAVRAKLRKYEADRAWLLATPEHFTIIKAIETVEGLRLWTLALAAMGKAK